MRNIEGRSTHEVRRAAPLHYWARADNARLVAHLLSRALPAGALSNAASGAGYTGDPAIAASEAFRRESALALELILKAVIAQKIESGAAKKGLLRVPFTHDVPQLWAEAGLPRLASEDRRLLLFAKSQLLWSGRYAAPKDDESYEKERAADDALKTSTSESGSFIKKLLPFDWENFSRIYAIALAEFHKYRP